MITMIGTPANHKMISRKIQSSSIRTL